MGIKLKEKTQRIIRRIRHPLFPTKPEVIEFLIWLTKAGITLEPNWGVYNCLAEAFGHNSEKDVFYYWEPDIQYNIEIDRCWQKKKFSVVAIIKTSFETGFKEKLYFDEFIVLEDLKRFFSALDAHLKLGLKYKKDFEWLN